MLHESLSYPNMWDYTEEDGECLVWTGAIDNGVPTYKGRGKRRLVRREILEQYRPFDPALVVVTTCETPLCVHPEHLEAITRQESGRRSAQR